MRVGVLANEFYDPGGRVGGFGWAAREAARALSARGDEVVFLTGERHARDIGRRPRVHGRPLVPRRRNIVAHVAALRRARLDVLLTIDFRDNYLPVLRVLGDVPLVVWVRDPRSPAEAGRVATLRMPAGRTPPQGIAPTDCTQLGRLARRRGRRVVLASYAPEALGDRVPETYDLPGATLELLPNPVPLDVPTGPEAAEPRVVFLGRLDPIKRPWVLVEIARRMPHVRFDVLGRRHFTGDGSWSPRDLPPNVHLAGNVDGAAKHAALAAAWALVNTSAHEAVPVSFFEAMAAATPIVSGVDPAGTVSRTGIAVCHAEGDGLEAVDHYVGALARLIADDALRRRLGGAGRTWVEDRHGVARFLTAFDELALRAGARAGRRGQAA
jgi:glycosyltransferase involved in cell wall biosynthesis